MIIFVFTLLSSLVFYVTDMQQDVITFIAHRKNRVNIPDFDKHIDKERHLIENLFQKLKRFRRVATRYEKLQKNYAAVVSIASIMVWINTLY